MHKDISFINVTVLGLDTKLYYTFRAWKYSETTKKRWPHNRKVNCESLVKFAWERFEAHQDNTPCITRHRFSEWKFMITGRLFIGLLLLFLSITTAQSTSNGYSCFWQICYGLVKMTRGILRLGLSRKIKRHNHRHKSEGGSDRKDLSDFNKEITHAIHAKICKNKLLQHEYLTRKFYLSLFWRTWSTIYQLFIIGWYVLFLSPGSKNIWKVWRDCTYWI